MTQRIGFDDRRTMLTLPEWGEDADLLASVRACIDAQRAVITPESLDIERAKREVTPEALEAILRSGHEVKGVASERDVTNAVVFNAHHIAGSVLDRRVAALRRRLDARVARKLRRLFAPGERPSVISSGQFWYPPGGYMGWHTNSSFPGWRLYITHTERPGVSFFRYRDVETGEIVTSTDDTWDFRMFHISQQRLLWHTVYSETHRFSFGFMIRPWTLRGALRRPLRGLARLLGG